MFRNKKFLMDTIGIGTGTREDTLLLLGLLFDEIKNEGVTDKVLGEYIFIRDYIDKNRGVIGNKSYNIISLGTFLQRVNLILSRYNYNTLSNEEIEKIKEKEQNGEIQSVEIDIVFDNIEDKIEINNTYKTNGNNINACTGIYGIYVDNKLVYIGRTIAGFGERYGEHLRALKSSNVYLYQQLRNYKDAGCEISLKPLIALERLQMINKRTINVKELNCMEMALIEVLKPELNVESRLKPYVFRNH